MSDRTPIILPDGRRVTLTPRHVIDGQRVARARYRAPASLLPVPGPIDWTAGGKITYPMDANDRYGCCMYASACHMDNTFTGMVAQFSGSGSQSVFDVGTLVQRYTRLSGGDNGLSEGQIVGEWHRGLCGIPDATIEDSLDIDVTDAALVRSAMYLFGGVFFILSVPDRWINSAAAGATWDAPATPNPRNGHGVCWVGATADDAYDLVTWGIVLKITRRGVSCCDPSGFVVFSKRWFDPRTGLAPNGFTYDQLAQAWKQAGGKDLPPSPFPSILPAA